MNDGSTNKMQPMAAFGGVIAIAGCGFMSASGCATPAAVGAGYDRCPEGQERVRVGPTGQAPKYICRDAG